MMTKYQLVFVKMESALQKVFNRNKLRAMDYKQEAYQEIKQLAIIRNKKINFQAYKILEQTKQQGVLKL